MLEALRFFFWPGSHGIKLTGFRFLLLDTSSPEISTLA